MRYTSHLDLHRTWERSFRRAGLPLAYSQGFNPRPRLNLAAALPLGFTSHAELLDAWLERDLLVSEIEAALIAALPPGLKIQEINLVDLHSPALQKQIGAMEYAITFLEPVADLEARCEILLQETSLPREKRGKQYNLRPLIFDLYSLPKGECGFDQLCVVLSAEEGATGRPEEVVAELGVAPELARYHRTSLIFKTAKI